MRVLLPVIVGMVGVVLGMVACSPAPSHSATGSVADFLARTWPEGAGGTVLAARGDRITYCEGVGLADREARTAATCDTVYDIMSVTKQFTAAAILKLEMLGKLRVTDPISTYVGPVPAGKRKITLHHLLTHTSGMVEGLGDDYEVLSRDAMLAAALASKPLADPGAEFHYSNTGYSVLAAIVEKVSGLSYEQFLAQYLFTPAGMTKTGYVLPQWDRDQVAVEYDDKGKSQGRPYDHPWAADGPHWNLRGNGGILSTARDMFRWHQALTGDAVLSAAAKKKLFHPHVQIPEETDEFYAYGWDILDKRIAWHNGGNSWSLSNFARSLGDSPENAVMTFWVSNHAYQEPGWNIEDMELELTRGILDRTRTQRP